jgi:purine-binding chemotaxis protein CheW
LQIAILKSEIKQEGSMSVAETTETTQYLTFKLDDEIFALDISKVREVLDFTAITKVPRTPDFMRGVINLRGSVVPVVDLRLKFGMSKTEQTVNTCIIITEVAVDGETTVLGALADSVQEVMELGPDQIEPAPKIGTKLDTQFIMGMGKQNERFVIMLDIDKVFSVDELALVRAEGQTKPEGGVVR